MPNKLSHQDFIERLSGISSSVDVLEEYRGMYVPIKVRHPCGHELLQRPLNLVAGKGCRLCSNNVKKDHDWFVKTASANYPNIEIIGRYDGMHKNIKVRCKTCDITYERPTTTLIHNSGGSGGCKSCTPIFTGMNNRIGLKSYIKRLSRTNSSFILIKNYTTAHSRAVFKCVTCGTKSQEIPWSVLKGKRCNICFPLSRYSKVCSDWIEDIRYVTEEKIAWVNDGGERRIEGTRYFGDGFINRYNLVLEMNGSYWHGHPQSRCKPKNRELYWTKSMIKIHTLLKLKYNLLIGWEHQYEKKGTLGYLIVQKKTAKFKRLARTLCVPCITTEEFLPSIFIEKAGS